MPDPSPNTYLTLGVFSPPSTTNTDIEVTPSSSGVILKSPNTVRWRITVDNAGNLVKTSL